MADTSFFVNNYCKLSLYFKVDSQFMRICHKKILVCK